MLSCFMQVNDETVFLRLVMNKALQKPKGTAFVEFRFPDGAAKAAAASERQRCILGPLPATREPLPLSRCLFMR